MSVHVSGDGTFMRLDLVRRFVEYTQNYPADTIVQAGVIGKHLLTEYSDLQGLQTRPSYASPAPAGGENDKSTKSPKEQRK